jgi:hypothetical protein
MSWVRGTVKIVSSHSLLSLTLSVLRPQDFPRNDRDVLYGLLMAYNLTALF